MSNTQKKFLSVQDMVLIAVFTAIMAICSWISVSAGPVPFTLQTFAVFVTIAVVVYILLGIIGVPVFAGLTGGPSVIAGPTGGFIVGFILTAIIIGLLMNLTNGKSEVVKLVITVVAMVLGDVACFAIGTVWFMVVTNNTVAVALTYCVIPYIIPDIAKIVVATIIANRVKKYVQIFN